MRFDLSEQVTGAELRSGVGIFTFGREALEGMLTRFGEIGLEVDAFTVDRDRVTAAVLFPEGEEFPKEGFGPELEEEEYFRLTLGGRRLREGRGLGGTWETVLAAEGIPLRLSCADGTGIVQYLPLRTRPAVLMLLERTFGIRIL